MAIQGRMSSAENFAVRPLDKGMILDRASQVLPDGAFIRLKDFIATTEGPFRRPGFTQFAGGATVPYRYVDYVTLWRTQGDQISYLITEKSIYRVNPISGFTEIAWDLVGSGAQVLSGALIDPAATFESADVLVGDILRIGSDEVEIAEVLSDTQLRLAAPNPIPDGTGYDYTIHRALGPADIALPDWIVFGNFLLIADGKRPILKLDPDTDTLSYWTTDPAKKPGGIDFVPNCIASFQDRVYAGYTRDAVDGDQRQRIRWSTLADPTDFSLPTAYQDLPYVNGALRRLIPLENTLMAYFDDRVFMGIQTNNALLPVRFDAVETGNIGIVGPKAVTSFTGGHFFVGQDDIYLLTAQGAQRIGTPVARESIKVCQFPWRVCVTIDPWNNCIVFGFPKDNLYMENLWRYNYKSKGWSYDNIQTYMISNPVVNINLSWDDLSGTWDGLGQTFPQWNSIKFDDPRKFLFIESASALWKATEFGATDFATNPIQAIFETKDHDLGLPDSLKTYVRFGIKITAGTLLSEPLLFAVQVSTNRGRTWKPIGDLIIPMDRDEGYINFRATGSTVRFRATSTSAVESYAINEYVLRCRAHGAELDTSTQE